MRGKEELRSAFSFCWLIFILTLRPTAEASDDSLYAGIFTFFFYAGEHRTETLDFIIFLVCHRGNVSESIIVGCSAPLPEIRGHNFGRLAWQSSSSFLLDVNCPSGISSLS